MDEKLKDLIFKAGLSPVYKQRLLMQLSQMHIDEPVGYFLNESLENRNPEDVECALMLGFVAGFSTSQAVILCLLLDEMWHHKHEDIVEVLSDLRAEVSTDSLMRAATRKLSYLDYNDSQSLNSKAMWALLKVGDRGISQLEKLKNHCDPWISSEATKIASHI